MSIYNRRNVVLDMAATKATMALEYMPMKWWSWTSKKPRPANRNSDYLDVIETKKGFCIVTPHRNLYINTPETEDFLEDLRVAEDLAESDFRKEVRLAKKKARY